MNFTELENRIGYRFKHPELLHMALRHSSYTNEHRMNRIDCNERLEFLGDAVLELLSSEFLYTEYKNDPEGSLTKLRASLVCEPTLAYDARGIELGKYLMLGKGEEVSGGRTRDSVTSDALEALIGAIYLDGGIDEARNFIHRFVLNDISNKQLFHDSKTILQEMIRGKSEGEVSYHLVEESGPDHEKLFKSEVWLNDCVLGCGEGRTKKASEQSAAYHAICQLRR